MTREKGFDNARETTLTAICDDLDELGNGFSLAFVMYDLVRLVNAVQWHALFRCVDALAKLITFGFQSLDRLKLKS